MSNQHSLHARTAQLHGTQQEWDQLATFVPASGELIVYDADEMSSVPRLKIGDGITPLLELPFLLDDVLRVIATSVSPDDTTYFVDSGRIELEDETT